MRVFVTVGNAAVHFNRLLTLVDEVLGTPGLGEIEGVCQFGVGTVQPRGLRCVRMLSRADFADELRAADAVVTHAGVGSLSAAIRAGHRPIVLPRRSAHHEVVNDHQLEIARELAARGLITVVEDTTSLRAALLAQTRAPAARGAALGGALSAIRDSFNRGPSRVPGGAELLLRLLAVAAPPLDRLRVR